MGEDPDPSAVYSLQCFARISGLPDFCAYLTRGCHSTQESNPDTTENKLRNSQPKITVNSSATQTTEASTQNVTIYMKSAEEIGRLRMARSSSVRQDVTRRAKDKGKIPTELPAPSVSSSGCTEPYGLCTGADKDCSLCGELRGMGYLR